MPKENPKGLVVHCMIHREALAFRSCLDQVIAIVNFIKSRRLASRLSSQFCEAMDSDYKCILNHTNVSWLLRGKVIKVCRLLKAELISFLEAEKKTLDFLFMTRFGRLR